MFWCKQVVMAFWLVAASSALANDPMDLLRETDDFAHAVNVNQTREQVVDYEIGLGAMRKLRGVWGFKHSERQSGELTRYTWQVIDGFTSSELLTGMEAALDAQTLLFSCDGRSCGKGAQWANRVFRERLLYGRDDLQQYRVYGTDNAQGRYRLLLFASARTADRQYLHAELLRIAP